jgi:hypothetical protein
MFGLDSLEIGLGGTGDEEGLGARNTMESVTTAWARVSSIPLRSTANTMQTVKRAWSTSYWRACQYQSVGRWTM